MLMQSFPFSKGQSTGNGLTLRDANSPSWSLENMGRAAVMLSAVLLAILILYSPVSSLLFFKADRRIGIIVRRNITEE